jgi:diguanylate cyclase (GGDEF)-like protein
MAEAFLAPSSQAAAPAASPDAIELLDPRAILTSIGEVVYDWDIATDRLAWGANASDVLGCTIDQRLDTGRVFAAFIEPGSGQTRHDVILSTLAAPAPSGGRYRTRYGLRLGGSAVAVEDSGRWFPGSDGYPARAHGVVRVLRAPAPTATTNGHGEKPERAAVVAELAAALERSRVAGRTLALMFVAIDDLSRLAESLGDEAVDQMFVAVIGRLAAASRGKDRLIRFSGNRLALILDSCATKQAAEAAGRFIRAIEKSPIGTTSGSVGVFVKIGVAVANDRDIDATQLLRQAEDALTEAKRRHCPFLIFSRDIAVEARRHRADAANLDIVAALNERRLRIARQPVVDARTLERAFDEVLTRIERPDGSIVPASEIVPAAERLGLIRLVDERVLELTVACLAREPQARLAINVSAMTLRDPDWLASFAAHLGAHPGVAKRLIVEVTETVAIEDLEATRRCLATIKDLGVLVAIDDFGAGYTSFRSLRALPIDIIKIDGAFVQNISRSSDDRFFVRALVDLARQLGVKVVAEWVEDAEAAAILAEWGVDFLQGDGVGGSPEIDAPPPQHGDKIAL